MFINLFITFSIGLSQVITISSSRLNYQLNIQEKQKISIAGNSTAMSIEYTECNKKIFRKFHQKVEKLLVSGIHYNSPEEGFLAVSADKEKFFVAPGNRNGIQFRLIPEEFQRLKIQEKILCSK